MRATCADITIRAFNFGPSFFKENNPNLFANCFTEDWSIGGGKDGYKVVNEQFAGNSSLNNYELVDTIRADFEVIMKNMLNSF